MPLLIKEITIHTDRTKNEIIKLLRETTEEKKGILDVKFKAYKDFTGYVNDKEFLIKSLKGFQREYNPKAKGIFEENEYGGVSVLLKIYPSIFISIALISLFFFFVYLTYLFISDCIASGNFNNPFGFLSIISLIVLAVNWLFYFNKVKFIETKIIGIIKSIDKQM